MKESTAGMGTSIWTTIWLMIWIAAMFCVTYMVIRLLPAQRVYPTCKNYVKNSFIAQAPIMPIVQRNHIMPEKRVIPEPMPVPVCKNNEYSIAYRYGDL